MEDKPVPDGMPLPTRVLDREPSATLEPRPAVRRFGDYDLLEEIARGGMGVVYRARQRRLDRVVAVKLILAGPFASPQVIQRFRGEVTAAALLQHPNIVAIHDVGVHDGQHYFSMDYIEGQNLSQLVGNRPLPSAKAARYVQIVADAIQYAHQQGILHRDLKPANVLVDASDQPRITDFGLAKRLDGDASLTLTGQMLGSPNFMPPEQASALRGKVGRYSDVYGLGAILYYLLTARPPFQAESFESVVHQVLATDPVSPRLFNPSVPRDLETICLKCLHKEPPRRYPSAQVLADELGRFLRQEPIQAHPVTRAQRAWRWCRRKPALATLIVALHLVLALGLLGVLWAWNRATVSESSTRRLLYTADMNRVYQAWEAGNLQLAEQLLQAHRPQARQEDLRGFEWRYLTNLCRDESRLTFTNVHFVHREDEWAGHHGLALATDDRMVIAASDNTLKWLDCRTHDEALSKPVGREAITELAMAMDQPGLLAYHTDRVTLLAPTDETWLAPGVGGDPGSAGAFALSWDGAWLAVAGTNRSVLMFDVKTRTPTGPECDLGDGVSSLAFSPDARYLACGTFGTKVYILEAPTLKQVNVLSNNTAFVTRLVFNRTGTQLASGCNDSHIRVWSFPECELVRDLTGHHGMIGDLAFSPDGRRLASGGTDHTIRLWKLANPADQTLLHGHRGPVKSVLFSRDGNRLFTGSDDGTVKVWDTSPQQATNILHHAGYTADVCFSPDGTLLAVADYTSRTAVLWQVSDQRYLGTSGQHADRCTSVKFSPDGKLLATVGGNDVIQIWSLPSVEKVQDLPAGGDEGSVAFHPIKPLLAVGCDDIRFFDLAEHTQVSVLAHAPTNGVRAITFSPHGDWIALGMDGGQVSIWDMDTGRQSCSFQEHASAVSALCVSHSGRWLASGGLDHQAVIYDVARRRAIANLEDHRLGVYALAFAPDDKTLVSTSWDGDIRFWCVANHEVALTLAHDGGPVTSVAFSPKGNLMATTCSDRTVRLWPAEAW